MELKGLSIVITGSGRGIGRAIACLCAEEGADIVANDIDPNGLKETQRFLNARGARCVTFRGDVSNRMEAEELIGTAVKILGHVDVIVNNAAIVRNASFLDLTEEDWDEVIKVNLKGVFNCAQTAARHMVQRRRGRIINISSRAYLGAEGMANYAASKAGILGLTRSMAMELGPYGINVNAIAPGMIDTDLTRRSSIQARVEKTPLRRIGVPKDIAHAVVFLASERASYVTGEVLHVTGGFY